MKRQGTEYKKVFLEHISDKELVSRICKEFLKINKKKAIEKQGKELNLPFKKRVYTVY